MFVEISFREGRIGGDDHEIPFTFKVSLRKAALIVRFEKPISFDRNSVSRSIPTNAAELTEIRRARESLERSLKGGIGVDPEKFSLALKGELDRKSASTREGELKLVQTIPEIMVTPFPEGGSAYSWSLEPTWKDFLRGQPWDPASSPRMRVGYKEKVGSLEPTISVEVRYAFEDIHIYDLETKADSIFGIAKDEVFGVVNRKAAVQHLKRLLCESDLHPANLDNRFNEVLLASLIAVEN